MQFTRGGGPDSCSSRRGGDLIHAVHKGGDLIHAVHKGVDLIHAVHKGGGHMETSLTGLKVKPLHAQLHSRVGQFFARDFRNSTRERQFAQKDDDDK